jgi:SAM-dependent methyltransferase
MGQHFSSPRAACCGKVLAKHIPSGKLPAGFPISAEICEGHLPKEYKKPRFFKVLRESRAEVGQAELKDAYDHIHESYDQFWLDQAATPIETLVTELPIEDCRMIFEAGCGTGYATKLLSSRLAERAQLIAVDLSDEMLEEARKRPALRNRSNIKLRTGDALDEMKKEGPFDLIFSSWVLGYIPLAPFFAAAYQALKKEGLLAFIVHKENSPREPLEIFGEIIGRHPSALQKRVAFDFPRDLGYLKSAVEGTGFELLDTCEDAITFQYSTPEGVLEHLLKSGAGTAFYEALDPNQRPELEKEFLEILAGRRRAENRFDVVHDYLVCVARSK